MSNIALFPGENAVLRRRCLGILGHGPITVDGSQLDSRLAGMKRRPAAIDCNCNCEVLREAKNAENEIY